MVETDQWAKSNMFVTLGCVQILQKDQWVKAFIICTCYLLRTSLSMPQPPDTPSCFDQLSLPSFDDELFSDQDKLLASFSKSGSWRAQTPITPRRIICEALAAAYASPFDDVSNADTTFGQSSSNAYDSTSMTRRVNAEDEPIYGLRILMPGANSTKHRGISEFQRRPDYPPPVTKLSGKRR